ncbi:hypothetical protein [Accumulibacter sp.]|uniref:hypothetical protein n=1 Tax=Accumulibacter sp. TaxID=2053492 RepID=UPI00257A0E5D|nr:hypothetical protein [Accumulibacter sp.]
MAGDRRPPRRAAARVASGQDPHRADRGAATFLGYVLEAGGRRHLTEENLRRFRNRLRGLRDRWRAGAVDEAEIEQRVSSWIAHAGHADTWRLRHALLRGGWFDPSREPDGPPVGRVLRGGSWNNRPQNARSAQRYRNDTTNRNDNNGFRLASALPIARADASTDARVCMEASTGRHDECRIPPPSCRATGTGAEPLAGARRAAPGRRVVHPDSVPGSEYPTAGAQPYFDVLGRAAGAPGKGHYSLDYHGWHLIALPRGQPVPAPGAQSTPAVQNFDSPSVGPEGQRDRLRDLLDDGWQGRRYCAAREKRTDKPAKHAAKPGMAAIGGAVTGSVRGAGRSTGCLRAQPTSIARGR